jgi:hypothetical protein
MLHADANMCISEVLSLDELGLFDLFDCINQVLNIVV